MTQPAGRGQRSRIVIDVERARAEARSGGRRRLGRRGRLLSVAGLVVLGVVLVAVAGTYAWWRSYKRSPAYSLALLVDAAQHDDAQGVESLIDADQIAQGFVPQVIDNLAGAGSPLAPQARASLSTALPALLPRVRETMRDEVAREVKGFAKEDAASRVPFFVKALGVRQATSVTERGDAATVTLKAGERPVELAMRRDGERWKVVTVKDAQLATEIATRLAASLPVSQQPTPPPPRRRGGR
jgi:uncharacterized membrane protein